MSGPAPHVIPASRYRPDVSDCYVTLGLAGSGARFTDLTLGTVRTPPGSPPKKGSGDGSAKVHYK